MVQLAAKYNFLLVVFGISIRPFIVPTSLSYVPWAVLNILICGSVYFLIRSGKLGKYSTLALFSATFFALISLLTLSGGIHGHVVYLVPIVPVFAGLILSTRSFWITTLFNIVLIVAMAVLSVPAEATSFPVEIVRKAVWLILATIMGAGFSRSYARENELLADALKHEANIDYLTRVLNRRGIEQRLNDQAELAKARQRPLCLMMIDLDYFKLYNDFNGHMAGDQCLKDISHMLNNRVVATGGYLGRYGGEEFVIVLSDSSLKKTDEFAQDLREAVEKMAIPYKKGQPEVLTICVGYCYQEGDRITDVETMLYRADEMLYQCKSEGRNMVKGYMDIRAEKLSA